MDKCYQGKSPGEPITGHNGTWSTRDLADRPIRQCRGLNGPFKLDPDSTMTSLHSQTVKSSLPNNPTVCV